MIERYSMQEEAEALRALERTIGLPQNHDELKAMLNAVRAEERERCARIAEYFDQLQPATIASAIRNEKIGESEERTSAQDGGLAE